MAKRAFPFCTYGRARPGKTAVRTAVPRCLLTRKRSQVQTLSRPPHRGRAQAGSLRPAGCFRSPLSSPRAANGQQLPVNRGWTGRYRRPTCRAAIACLSGRAVALNLIRAFSSRSRTCSQVSLRRSPRCPVPGCDSLSRQLRRSRQQGRAHQVPVRPVADAVGVPVLDTGTRSARPTRQGRPSSTADQAGWSVARTWSTTAPPAGSSSSALTSRPTTQT